MGAALALTCFPQLFNLFRTLIDRWDKYFYEHRKKSEKKYLDIIDKNFTTVREIQAVRSSFKRCNSSSIKKVDGIAVTSKK